HFKTHARLRFLLRFQQVRKIIDPTCQVQALDKCLYMIETLRRLREGKGRRGFTDGSERFITCVRFTTLPPINKGLCARNVLQTKDHHSELVTRRYSTQAAHGQNLLVNMTRQENTAPNVSQFISEQIHF